MFRKGKRNNHNTRHTNVIEPFISPTKEADEKSKILIEIDLLKRKHSGLINAIESKSQKLNIQDGGCEVIQKEHSEKIEKLQDEYVVWFNKVQDKDERYTSLNISIGGLQETEEKLNKTIFTLRELRDGFKEDVKKLVKIHNNIKSNNETELRNIKQNIVKQYNIYKVVCKQNKDEKKELANLITESQRENSVLAQRQRDLQIYEARLKKKYPNEIILIN